MRKTPCGEFFYAECKMLNAELSLLPLTREARKWDDFASSPTFLIKFNFGIKQLKGFICHCNYTNLLIKIMITISHFTLCNQFFSIKSVSTCSHRYHIFTKSTPINIGFIFIITKAIFLIYTKNIFAFHNNSPFIF